eukprot:TRINITY_DN1948_c1_g1_i1.p2 TRINITY_DN1948_c1_g1~~TRINITY_DN1948_c1_g1_i1.p2  ORF type:complete len:261 (+),score=110.88 TRINITY_DN1948_c1_g1_i1:78-785(+)
MSLGADVLSQVQYPEGATFIAAQELSPERRSIYATAYPALATGAVGAALCDEGGTKVQHVVHCPPGGTPTVVIIEEGCKIMYEDLPPSRMVEYRFKEGGGWMLSRMGPEACEMYRGQKFKAWKQMLDEPSCEAALRRMLEGGLVNRLFDENVLPTPEDQLAQWQVVDQATGKTISIPHPVAELRLWDAEAGEYRTMSAVLAGAPEDDGVEQAWQGILDELRAKHGTEYINGFLKA